MEVDETSSTSNHPSQKTSIPKRARTESFSTNPEKSSFLLTKTQSYFATLSPGLEFVAEEELKELINPSVIKRIDKSGKIFFATDKKIEEVLKLRSIDGLYAFVAEVNEIPSDESGLQHLKHVAAKADWEAALHMWRSSSPVFTTIPSSNSQQTNNSTSTTQQSDTTASTADAPTTSDENDSTSSTTISSEEQTNPLSISTATYPNNNENSNHPNASSSSASTDSQSSSSTSNTITNSDHMEVILNDTTTNNNNDNTNNNTNNNISDTIVFRVTGKRTGYQTYKSPQLAGFVGAGLIQRYGWKVDLRRYNMEILADLNRDTLVLGISLAHTPLYERHRSALGVTSLRPSVAYCMSRIARIQPGNVVMDPMMGVGTIPIEAAEVWKTAYFIGGDISEEAVKKAAENQKEAGVENIQLFLWNVYRLPMATASVDIVISDIPFGRRVGSFKKNQKLYPRLFREITRIVRNNGKAIILTLEKGLMKSILLKNMYWNLLQLYPVDIGGYQVGLYLLQRTTATIPVAAAAVPSVQPTHLAPQP